MARALDLSRIKVVGFIPSFNPKCGYPEFNINNSTNTLTEKKNYDFNSVPKERIAKPIPKHIKNAKRAFKKSNPDYKPKDTLLLAFDAETSNSIAWRTR